MTTKQQIIKYMNEARSTPRMTNMVKFINEKSTATAKVNTKSHFHVGHTHSSGVRIGSGHSTIHEEITPKDFAVWVYENIMNRKHWRFSGSTMTKGDTSMTFAEWDTQEIENEKNDTTN
jgi:hypothetical protein